MEQPLESPTTVTPAIDVIPIQRTSRLRLLRRSPSAMIGTAIIVFWIVMAIIGPVIVPYGINDIDAGKVWTAPTAQHLMGTDALGRDIFSRLIIAARLMMLLPPLAVAIGVIFGAAVGLWAGYRGGWLDEIVMRFMDVMMAFPTVMLYLMIVVAFGQSSTTVVLAIAIANIPAIARLVRGLVLDLRSREFVSAARMRGESTYYILFHEILPNATGPILIDALVRIGYAAFAIGALGFLGLGVPPPNPDWGGMAADGRQAIILQPTAALFPALAIASIVIACNLIADGLNAASKKDE